MAKYRITSLPGYTKRIPLSKAQFGGLNKFLEGGGPCPPDKEIYPQFNQFGCISISQYNKLIEQTKNNLLKQDLYKKTQLDDFNTLRKSRNDGDWGLAEKLLVEWKAKYPGQSSVCPKGDCPEYDLVLEPDPVIEEIPEEIPEIPELSLSGYPDAPIYNPSDYDMKIPTIGIGPGETKSKKHTKRLFNGKGQKYSWTSYSPTKDLDFGTREATRPIPKMIQKATGYDRNFMEGYEDEEGNYFPGEIEKAEEGNRQINFKGIASLKDKKEQERYNKEWEQHNIEKAGIREYNLNLIKEAGISPEEYVKKYGEFKYGGLHKFVAGGPSACPKGQYWNGTKCVPVQGFNPRALLTNAANAREAEAKAIEAARVAKEKARVAKLSEEDKNYEHFLGAPPKKAKPKVEPIPGSMQLKGDPYAITYEGELEKARLAAYEALSPEEKRALAEAQLAEEEKLLNEKSKMYSQYLEDNKFDQPLSNAFASDNTKVFNPLGPSSLEKNRNKYVQTEIEQEDFIMNEVLPFSKKKESHYKNVEKSKGDPKGDRYNEALAAENAYTGETPRYNAGEMFDYNKWKYNQHPEGYDPKTKLYYTSRGVYDPATGMYKPNPIPYQGTGAVEDFRPENYFIGGMGARAALIPLGEKFAASAAVQAIKTGFKTALPLGEAITSATAGTLTPANLLGLGFGAHGITTIKPNLDKFIEKPNLETGIDLGFSGLEILGSPGVGNMLMKGAKPIIDLGKAGVNKVGNFLNAKAAREAEMYEFGSKLNKFNRENYTGPQYYSEQPIQDALLLESGSVASVPGPTLLPIGTANEARSTVGSGLGSTPLLNEGAIGFNPTVSLDDIYNNISGGNRATLSRFLPEQNITREPSLFNYEDLYLNQRPLLEYQEYQAAVNEAGRRNMVNVADTRTQTEAIDAYETARAEQQAASERHLANPYNGDITSYQYNYARLANADEALRIAEENLALMAPDYISQPYISSSAIPGTTTGSIMSGSLSSGNANLNSGAISSAALPAESRSFDGLSQALGTSPTKNVNYSSATIDALTQYRPNNSFHNGQTIETQLSNITDPVDYANRLRELESAGSIDRTMYDELAEGLIAHIDNTPNPSIRSDAALDIISVDPDIVYTGSKLPENEVFSWLNNTSETEMDQALSNYNYDFDNIANFFADPNLSNEVRNVALNQIKDDFRYITEFGEINPNARPIDFSTGQILSPKLLKANNIADYKTLKINPKSKDVLKKTMYEDVELTTDTIPYSRTLNTSLPHLKNRSHIISDKELTKQLEAYEEAYAAVKGKGGKAEDLITAKLEDLRGTKYLRTIYADQMKAAGKDPSEILEYGIISSGKYSKSLIDKNGVVIGTVEFYPSTFEGLPYSKISETGLNYKYHGHSLKHGKFKTWEQSQEALTKRYLDELLETVDKTRRQNPIVVKVFTKQAEARAIETIKQLQINNNNRFGEALYSGVNASLLETRGRLATKEGFANTTLPDPITGVDVVRRRAEHGWRSWGKQYYEGVPRAAYLQGPSKDPHAYLNSTENFMHSPNFILRKLGGDVSKLSKFTQ